MRRRGHGGPWLAAALTGMLCACVEPLAPPLAPPPAPSPPLPQASADSEAMRAHLARVQAAYLDQGRLRTETAPKDAPFTARQLAENFLRIAFYDEFTPVGGTLVARRTATHLRRWETPIRMSVDFGPSVPAGQQLTDRTEIAHFASRLSRLTGVPIAMAPGRAGANFHVLMLDEDERRAAEPLLRELSPGIDAATLGSVTQMPRSTYCTAISQQPPDRYGYERAIIVIRAEHPDRLRLSCIHEELAQAMGLANDSPDARPSIFNDDEEFALLTSQDEMMLRILYDRRLRTGMTESEARPIVETIAAELIGGDS